MEDGCGSTDGPGKNEENKRERKLIFEDEEDDYKTKKRCTQSGISQPILDEISAVAAVQHRREQ